MTHRSVTVVGGGTGSFHVLSGLRGRPDLSIRSIVTMMDSGGDSGRLRDEFGVLPPGDIRRCLIALSEESSLLRHLFEWSEKPEFTCRWRWSPGDMAIWDNRCVLHRAINDYDDERVLHRTMILGDPPAGSAPRWRKPVPAVAASSVGYEYRGKGPLGR